MQGIIYYQCKDNSQVASLQPKYAMTMFAYSNRRKMLGELRKALYENGFPFFTVKGMDVAALYPVPALRSMGDLDMVMHTDDREKAIPVMESLGFSLDKKDYEYHYSKGSMIIEVHDHLVYDHFVKKSDKREYYEKCWENVHKNEQGYDELDWNLHFIFLIEHLWQHLTAHGVGIRQFMDIAVVTQASNQIGLDWCWIEAELKRIRMLDFAQTVLTLCEDWFGVNSPFSHAVISEEEKKKCLQTVLANGVFGFDNEEHDVNVMGKRFNEIGGPTYLRPIRYALKQFF